MAGAGLLTLPDYLKPELKLVFIGLNPGLYSARVGKYFANPKNRFWPALSASRLVGMNTTAGDERILLEKGIGFTDVVKRATSQINELAGDEVKGGVRGLCEKIEKFSPAAACFIGFQGYRWVFSVPASVTIRPGPQEEKIGSAKIYVLPSTSPANASYSLDRIVREFRRLKSWLEGLHITF